MEYANSSASFRINPTSCVSLRVMSCQSFPRSSWLLVRTANASANILVTCLSHLILFLWSFVWVFACSVFFWFTRCSLYHSTVFPLVFAKTCGVRLPTSSLAQLSMRFAMHAMRPNNENSKRGVQWIRRDHPRNWIDIDRNCLKPADMCIMRWSSLFRVGSSTFA